MHRSSRKARKTRRTDIKAGDQRVAPIAKAGADSLDRPEREEKRRQLVEEARQILAAPETEQVNELANKIISTPAATAADAIQKIGHDLQEMSLPLLEALVGSGQPDVELAVIDALGATKSERAVPLLISVIEEGKGKEAQKAARRSLFRLKSLGVTLDVMPHPREEAATPLGPTGKLTKAYMSNHDGDGGQILLATSDGPFGRLDTITVITHDARGVVHFDSFDASKKSWQRRFESLEKQRGLTLVEIPLDYFRHKVRQAIETGKAKGSPVPSGLMRWSPLIAEPEEAHEEHPVYREISIVEIKWNPQLLEESPRLFENEEMLGWRLPEKEVESYIEELSSVREGKVTLPPWVEKERIEGVIQRAMNQFFDAENRAYYKRRLEDMAYLLLHTDRALDGKRALAAAVAFGEQTGVPSPQHPFAAAMLKHTADFMLLEERAARTEGQRIVTDVSELAPFLTGEEELL